LDELAGRINAAHGRVLGHCRAGLRQALLTGQLLLRAKEAAGHGRFMTWVGASCSFGYETAAKYLRIAGRWQELDDGGGNLELLPDLTIAAALKAPARPRAGPAPEARRRPEGGRAGDDAGPGDGQPGREGEEAGTPDGPEPATAGSGSDDGAAPAEAVHAADPAEPGEQPAADDLNGLAAGEEVAVDPGLPAPASPRPEPMSEPPRDSAVAGPVTAVVDGADGLTDFRSDLRAALRAAHGQYRASGGDTRRVRSEWDATAPFRARACELLALPTPVELVPCDVCAGWTTGGRTCARCDGAGMVRAE
jgi:hypothetical protein